MISHFKNDQSFGGSEVIEGYCLQLLRSEPVILLSHLEDEFIAQIGAWFDDHKEYHGDLCCCSCDKYCVFTWERW